MPGRIMAIAAHPGDRMFTMDATVAQQIQHGGKGVFLSLSLKEKGAPKRRNTQPPKSRSACPGRRPSSSPTPMPDPI